MEKEYLNEIFGENVFSPAVMKEMLPKEAYEEIVRVQQGYGELGIETADIVARAMKEWAVQRGATHFCHWFQPLTGITAEKHDSFIEPLGDGTAITKFSGKNLVKGESDASSFPSGGLRSIFEARGYTAWDCSSPAFIRKSRATTVLYIPTAFCSYNGEALDKKTPLLRSIDAMNREALRVLRLLGNTTSKRVYAAVGPEQEYFLVRRDLYERREDLCLTGRTLFGAIPPKGQEMDDHYYGAIPERVGEFMKEVNDELWKLGVPAKTQHNEVAPGQHELATVYEECNIATDHNQLVMETLKRTAKRLGLACLLSEKPYAGVNGSGKHNNWSLITDDGIQLLNPGTEPHKNTLFILTLACVIRAVDQHSDLLAESVMSASNENRLGGNEAPPSIISMFLGTQLTDLLRQILETGDAKTSRITELFRTDVSSLANFDKDVTDRNRTSPFAFTGNKFEFRAVGSKDSLAKPNTVLNTIVAESLKEAGDRLKALLPGENASSEAREKAARQVAAEFISEHARIVFNGDNYSDEWKAEAERRGLPILHGVVEATDCLLHEDAIGMFDALGVYSRRETESRVEIKYETYAKSIRLEAVTMIDMAERYYIPAVIRFEGKIAKSLNEVKAAVPGVDTTVQEKLVERISGKLAEAYAAMTALREAAAAWKEFDNERDRAVFSRDTLKSAMAALRAPIDKLERMVSRADWPVPTYAELMDEN